MALRTFGWSVGISALALFAALLYGGPEALVLCLILGVLEVSLSFDNAVVNATVLERMGDFWQRLFLTLGVLIAVFGMRLVFPLLIVGITAHLGPVEAVRLALEQRPASDPTAIRRCSSRASAMPCSADVLAAIFLDFVLKEHEYSGSPGWSVRWPGWASSTSCP
jgi:hypothetical protein